MKFLEKLWKMRKNIEMLKLSQQKEEEKKKVFGVGTKLW